MPNILIIGFTKKRARAIRREIETIVKEAGQAGETLTTIISAETRSCYNSRPMPYVVFRDTDLSQTGEIAETINARLDLDVECVRIENFLGATALTKP